MKILMVDTETGGLDPQHWSILDVGVVLVEGVEQVPQACGEPEVDIHAAIRHVYSMRGGFSVPVKEAKILAHPRALEVNRITPSTWEGHSPADAVRYLENELFEQWGITKETVRDYLIGGWNVAFDVGFLKRLYRLAEVDYPFSHRTFDVQAVVRHECFRRGMEPDGYSLEKACEFFEIKYGNHTALGDAESTARVLTVL